MRRWIARASALALTLSLFAPAARTADDADPSAGLPAPPPGESPASDSNADADEAQRLEGGASTTNLDKDVEEADRAAQQAADDGLDRQASPGPAKPAAEAVRDLSGVVSISLAEAIRIGLERNLDLQVVRFDPYIAQEGVGIAWGSYDPSFSNEFGYGSVATPIASIITPTQTAIRQTQLDGATGLKGLIPWWGASYEVGYTGSRTFTNSTTNVFSPELDANVFANFSIPLLKNLIWNQPWTQLKAAQVVYEGSREDFRRQVMDIVSKIEVAYWEVIASREKLRVGEKSVETARALLDQTRTQYEVGVVSRVEVTEAEAGVAQRDFNLIVASNVFRAAQDDLSDLVFGESLRPGSTFRIETTDEPASFTAFEVDPDEATRKAFAKRPELALAKFEIARQEILLKFARNQTLPQLDAVLSYGRLGQAGELNPAALSSPFLSSISAADRTALVTSLDTSRSLAAANNDFFGDKPNEQFAARGVLSIPLGNQTAVHGAEKAAFELRKAMSRERRLEQDIVLGVRKAVRDLRSAQEGVVAAERSVAAASEQLRAERIRLENGESTPFNVLQRESDLVLAESEQIGALRAYRNSETNLERQQGTILESHRIRVDQVGTLP